MHTNKFHLCIALGFGLVLACSSATAGEILVATNIYQSVDPVSGGAHMITTKATDLVGHADGFNRGNAYANAHGSAQIGILKAGTNSGSTRNPHGGDAGAADVATMWTTSATMAHADWLGTRGRAIFSVFTPHSMWSYAKADPYFNGESSGLFVNTLYATSSFGTYSAELTHSFRNVGEYAPLTAGTTIFQQGPAGYSSTQYDATSNLDRMELIVDFIWGDTITFRNQMFARCGSYGSGNGTTDCKVDAARSSYWDGVLSVQNLNGQQVSGISLITTEGIDFAQSLVPSEVPEPGILYLFALAGPALAGLAFSRRRKS